jgi:hypothetical protein
MGYNLLMQGLMQRLKIERRRILKLSPDAKDYSIGECVTFRLNFETREPLMFRAEVVSIDDEHVHFRIIENCDVA